MKNIFRSCLSLPFISTLVIPGFAQTLPMDRGVAPDLRVTVRVYNLARVSASNLAQSEHEASRILHEAGIEIEWTECPCPQTPGPSGLMLRIIPRLFGSMRADFRDNDLGFAPTSADGGVLATIFFNRVEAITKGGSVAPILGSAIAHEFGHLLLGPNAHSSDGIMRARWSREFLRPANRASLHFTNEQSNLMRTHVSARAKPQEALQAPTPAAFGKEYAANENH